MTVISFETYSAAPVRPRLRLTSRGRLVFGVLAAAPVVLVALLLGAPGAVATDTSATTSFASVSIAPGQSLWQLAEQIAPNADPREVVADILALNNLGSADVQPGQELAIPAEYAAP